MTEKSKSLKDIMTIDHECDKIRDKNMMLIGQTRADAICDIPNLFENPPYRIDYHQLLQKWGLNTPNTTLFEEIDACPYCGFILDKNLTVKTK